MDNLPEVPWKSHSCLCNANLPAQFGESKRIILGIRFFQIKWEVSVFGDATCDQKLTVLRCAETTDTAWGGGIASRTGGGDNVTHQ